MDYLVFGTGMGATLVLVGLAGRAFGPSLRYRTPPRSADVLRAEQLVARIAWARFCSSLGASLALAGGFLLLVTAILVIVHVGDRVGTISILVALVAVILLMAFWSWAFVQRFGLLGIVTPKVRDEQPESRPDDYYDADTMTAPTTPTPSPPTPAPISTTTMRPSTTPVPTTTVAATTTAPVTAPAPGTTTTVAPVGPTTTSTMPPVTTTTTEAPKRSPYPSLMRRASVVVTPSTTPVPPLVTHADPSRSEIVNPSDAAALDRILSDGDESPKSSSVFDDLPTADDGELRITNEKPPNG